MPSVTTSGSGGRRGRFFAVVLALCGWEAYERVAFKRSQRKFYRAQVVTCNKRNSEALK